MRLPVLLLVFALLLAPTLILAAEESFFERGPFRVAGDGPCYLQLGAGVFDLGNKYTAAGAVAEVRIGRKLAFVGPAAGLVGNADGGFFAYAGVYADLLLGPVALTPVWSTGAYRQGESRDLGGTLQFRSSLALTWQLADGWRLGVLGAHISNGGLHDKNPGENELMLTVAFPF